MIQQDRVEGPEGPKLAPVIGRGGLRGIKEGQCWRWRELKAVNIGAKKEQTQMGDGGVGGHIGAD